MTDGEQLSEVASLNEIWAFKRLNHPCSFRRHLRVPGDDVLPPLDRQPNAYAVDGYRDGHGSDHLPPVVQSS
ncbi:MAG TPA: hypothetical protein VFH48_08855, partial [Chloroflexota bacterium]|nr:hypothetical protein [Chloroflexota bacterium]